MVVVVEGMRVTHSLEGAVAERDTAPDQVEQLQCLLDLYLELRELL
jgi:hypothetical protein